MRLFVRPVLVIALALTLSACGVGGPDTTGLTGSWEGEITSPAAGAPRYPVALDLTDTGARITGTGTVTGLPEGTLAFTVTDGQFIGADVGLTLAFTVTPFQGALTGTLVERSPGRVEGTFTGRNEANGDVTITLVDR